MLNNDNDDLYQKFETSDYYIPLYEHFFDENGYIKKKNVEYKSKSKKKMLKMNQNPKKNKKPVLNIRTVLLKRNYQNFLVNVPKIIPSTPTPSRVTPLTSIVIHQNHRRDK